ncbi:LOG family protein [Acetobacter vaccinii]|uniref:Cytokinin riboside 5'-monophosphate phosphoribohydrolase n=1 Tax=Acetobacter vaccinii TaxID=2592655 RepID=A0A5C1YLI7_9PROT|nr:TIGR00730 family Rossman fold protein [Acetobacter vaccinii]QEO17154.1 TIGR00730 family Rossman fold protein [Acetobacter vaccinii]
MTLNVRSVAVFCGSRTGHDPAYSQEAVRAGELLARHGVRLIYGGGANGLMGIVADATIRAGGSVTGIIPEFLKTREKMHEQVSELIVTTSMHERKQIMFAKADAFWILPGGFGTFDEMMEILTWRQLGRHDKPILLVNVGGWGDCVVAMLDAAVRQGFASAEARALLVSVPDVETALSLSGRAHDGVELPMDVL